MKAKVNKTTIRIVEDNILSLKVDTLVNSTIPTLSMSPELTARAGHVVVQHLSQLGWCDIGSAVATIAGNLPHRILIHAVPPKWGEGSERGKLANLVWEVLDLAENHQCRSIAVPPIATGTDGYPLENCAKTMLEQIIDFTFEPVKFLKDITLCVTSEAEKNAFEIELNRQLTNLSNGDIHQVLVG